MPRDNCTTTTASTAPIHTAAVHTAAVHTAAVSAATSLGANVLCLGAGRSTPDVLRDLVSKRSVLCSPVVSAVDLSVVARKYLRFRALMGDEVRVHYAVKSFADVVVVSTLARLGACFDCASRDEIDLVHATLTALGDGSPSVMGERVVYANPVRSLEDIRYALRLGVSLMTVDNVCELAKLAACGADDNDNSNTTTTTTNSNNNNNNTTIRVMIRIATDDATSFVPLSAKYGAHPREITPLLRAAARARGVQVVGVAFHVGSGASCVEPYRCALRAARDIFDAAGRMGMTLRVLDIGGGFPASEGRGGDVEVAEIAAVVRQGISSLFPKGVSILAEPGRFIAHECSSVAVRVLSVVDGGTGRRVHIGDGIYGTFRDALVVKEDYPASVLWRGGRGRVGRDGGVGDEGEGEGEGELCDIVGVTMEEEDVVGRGVSLPRVERGDWLLFESVGAYTHSLRSLRRDVPQPDVIYLCHAP